VNSDATPLLDVRGVSYRFLGVQALSNVSAAIGRGEILGLIGPNGSGKTTLLNVITGIYRAMSGCVLLEGRDITHLEPHAVAAGGVMRTFQAPRLFSRLGLLEHAIIPMSAVSRPVSLSSLVCNLGRPWASFNRAATEVLRRVSLTDATGVTAGSLSYGQKRTLELVRCLAGSPKLLLLDEPTAGLNRKETEDFHSLLGALASSSGIAILVIDHDIEFIQALCHRLLVLVNGKLISNGPPERVLADPQVIDSYLGEGLRNAVG